MTQFKASKFNFFEEALNFFHVFITQSSRNIKE